MWAHAHFIIHHGTLADAARFLTHPRNVANTPTTTLDEIRLMSKMQIPTWDQAAAAMFSSSSDSSDGSFKSSVTTRSPILALQLSEPGKHNLGRKSSADDGRKSSADVATSTTLTTTSTSPDKLTHH